MSAEQVVISIFGVAMSGLCGWIFGYMKGQCDMLRGQNDKCTHTAAQAATTKSKE